MSKDIGQIVRQDRQITTNEGSDAHCGVLLHLSEASEREHSPQTFRTAARWELGAPNIKFQLKGRRFDTAEDIQREKQIVLDTLKEKDYQEAFQP